MKIWLSLLLTCVSMAISCQEFAIRSFYLTDTVDEAHRITIKGVLEGPGLLFLDTNRCSIDSFGDPRICNLIPPTPINIELVRIEKEDLSGKKRKIYRLTGKLRSNYSLVVPDNPAGLYTLIINGEKLIPMTPITREIEEKGPSTLCFYATYRAERRGNSIIVYARGMHPSEGWRSYFERLPLLLFPDNHYKLVCEQPPERTGPPTPTPFEVSTSFRSTDPVNRVIIHDARGQHEVEVR